MTISNAKLDASFISDHMIKKFDAELLKYSVQRQIMCPICGDILDCIKNAVLIEDPQGHYTCTCFACYDASKDKLKKNTLSIQVCPSPMTTQAKIDRSICVQNLPDTLNDVPLRIRCMGGNRSIDSRYYTDGHTLIDGRYIDRQKQFDKLVNRPFYQKEEKGRERNIPIESIQGIIPNITDYRTLYFKEYRFLNADCSNWDNLLAVYTIGKNGDEIALNAYKLRFIDSVDRIKDIAGIESNKAISINSSHLLMPVRPPK